VIKVKPGAGKTSKLLVLGLILVLMFTGCSSNNSGKDSNTATNQGGDRAEGSNYPDGNTSTTSEPTKFTYLRPVWNPATYTKGGPYEQELFKQGNVEIDVQIMPVGDYITRVNTVMASGDIPDVLWGAGPLDPIWREYEEEGFFLPINRYLDRYPAIREAVPEGLWNLLTNENGDIYFIPNVLNPVIPFMNIYRQDIFEALAIPVPTTTDEFVAALEKIKDSDVDGNGKKDTIPFSLGVDFFLRDISTAFGVCYGCWTPAEDNPDWLEPWYVKESTIDFYVWMQDLHKRGLLDPEHNLNPDPSGAFNRFKAGQTAIMAEQIGSLPVFEAELRKTVPDGKFAILPPLKGPNGRQGGTLLYGTGFDKGFYVSAKASDPDGIFRYLNWTLTEGSDIRIWGFEGKTFTIDAEGNKVGIPDADRAPEYKASQIEPLQLLERTYSERRDMSLVEQSYKNAGMGDRFADAYAKYQQAASNLVVNYRDPKIITPTEEEIGSQIYNDHLNEVISGFIINHNLTKQDWLNAVAAWRQAGGDQIIRELNEMQTDKSKPEF
jgi:ABC-type glycerol-3-phosphate transport system substrate-binding protein